MRLRCRRNCFGSRAKRRSDPCGCNSAGCEVVSRESWPKRVFIASEATLSGNITSMPVLLIVGSKCTMAASHADSPVSHVEYAPRALLSLENKTEQTDGRTDARPTHYAYTRLNATSVIIGDVIVTSVSKHTKPASDNTVDRNVDVEQRSKNRTGIPAWRRWGNPRLHMFNMVSL